MDNLTVAIEIDSDFTKLYEPNLVFHIIKCTECILGLFGNILTILAVIKFDKLKTGSNVILLSIACSDICTLSAFILESSADLVAYLEYMAFWRPFCHTLMTLGYFGGIINAHGICFTACDRFIAVKYPLFYRNKMKFYKWLKINAIMWMLHLLRLGIESPLAMSVNCKKLCRSENVYNPRIYPFTMMLYFSILSMATTFLYFLVAFLIFKQHKSVGTSNASAKQQKLQKSITKTMAIVVGK